MSFYLLSCLFLFALFLLLLLVILFFQENPSEQELKVSTMKVKGADNSKDSAEVGECLFALLYSFNLL